MDTEITGSRRAWWWAAAFAILAALSAVVVHHGVFPYDSGDHDEPVYRYQAQMLRDGELTIPRSQEQFFRPWLSGPHGDRLVLAFQPLWPAVLMVSDLAGGSTVPALALSAAGAVLAAYLAALELTRRRVHAAAVAGLVATSPFVIILGGTHLNYIASLGLGAALAGAVLRSARLHSAGWAVTAGGIAGLLLLSRPFDAVLFSLPLGVYLITHPWYRERRMRLLLPILGAIPFVILAGLYNHAITGSATTFATTVQSGGWAAFGFGVRSVAADTPRINYSLPGALRAQATNIAALPAWIFGNYLAVLVGGWGFVSSRRRDPRTAWLLLAMVAVFPVGYLAWWATALTSGGAFTGLGPHYLVPALLPLAVLTVEGVAALLDARRPSIGLRVVGIAIGVAVTAAFLVPIAAEKSPVTEGYRRYSQSIDRQLHARSGQRQLVIQARANAPYLMRSFPFIANPPSLETDRLYAVDRGAAGIDLLRTQKDRVAFRIVEQLDPGQDFDEGRPRVVPTRIVAGPSVTIRADFVNTTEEPVAVAYLRFRDRRHAVIVDRDSRRGRRYTVRWTVTPGEVRADRGTPTGFPRVPPARMSRSRGDGPAPDYELVVGSAFAPRERTADPLRAEHRFYARTRAGRVEALTAPEQWVRLGAPFDAWLPLTTARELDVEITLGG